MSSSLAELVDLFPTLIELCSLKTPARLEGASLAAFPRVPDEQARPRRSRSTRVRLSSTVIRIGYAPLLIPGQLGNYEGGEEPVGLCVLPQTLTGHGQEEPTIDGAVLSDHLDGLFESSSALLVLASAVCY